MNIQLLVVLLIAHLVGDFTFQANRLCSCKEKHGFFGYALYLHCLIVMLISWLFVFSRCFFCCAIFIGLTHMLVDGLKVYILKRSECCQKHKLPLFLTDQFMHVGVLAVIATCYNSHAFWFTNLFKTESPDGILWPLLVLSLVACNKPANVLVKHVLETISISPNATSPANVHAGEWIGTLERYLTLVFVILGQYEAIGLVYAAKTILRYKDDETLKTEYVLVGTLLSLSVALACGLLVTQIHSL